MSRSFCCVAYVGLTPRRRVLPPPAWAAPAPSRDLDLSRSEPDAMGGRLTSGMDVVPDTIVSSTGSTMLGSASCP
eukprot:6552954-Alexandrium_andersonii.AAC.1